MRLRCPGTDFLLDAKPVYVKCPKCKKEVEMFSYEQKITCYYCGATVFKEKAPSCFDWCKYSKECMESLGIKKDDFNQTLKE